MRIINALLYINYTSIVFSFIKVYLLIIKQRVQRERVYFSRYFQYLE